VKFTNIELLERGLGFEEIIVKGSGLSIWDFYFHALESLVVLSFPQPLSFSLVLPKPLSETHTRSSDGRNPV
jgi:hypothetical protein